MVADRDTLKSLGLELFSKDFDNIESQYLNLIYNPMFDEVMERNIFERTLGYMRWKCAICDEDILTNRNRYDVENFVCDGCKEHYNNKNLVIDKRIMDSRTKMYKYLEDRLYEELEDNLKRGK